MIQLDLKVCYGILICTGKKEPNEKRGRRSITSAAILPQDGKPRQETTAEKWRLSHYGIVSAPGSSCA